MTHPGVHAAVQPDASASVLAGADGTTEASITYRELEERSAQLAHLLHERGLRPGDVIALLAENYVRYFEAYWAAMRSGLYLTAINWHLAPEEAAYLVENSGAQALITTQAQSATAVAMLPLIPQCAVRLMMASAGMDAGPAPGYESYEAALATQPTTPLADQPRGEVMLYSSGTTGRPKGIRRPLSGKRLGDEGAAGASQLERFLLGMDETSRYLCPAPLYHSAGLQWSAGVHELGGTLVVLERFDAETFLRTVQEQRITHAQVVPTMFVRMLKLPAEVRAQYDTSSLQRIVHAAAPCPVDVKRQMIEWLGPIVDEYYAGTEGVGLTFIGAKDWLAHPGSVGKSVMGIPRVCDEEGELVPNGTPGLVFFEREGEHFTYHNDPEKTRDSRHPQHANWATVGDVGYLDDDGYLYLTDRKSFTIISGGVNIYPAEIESRLIMHEAVTDVAVFGLPDPEMGEYVHAVVELSAGAVASPTLAQELRSFVREQLAGYKVPRIIDFRAELPRMPTGKLAKGLLRDEYRSAVTQTPAQ